MQILMFFLLVCFIIGASDVGRRVREHPTLLLAFSFMIAASYYSLRSVL